MILIQVSVVAGSPPGSQLRLESLLNPGYIIADENTIKRPARVREPIRPWNRIPRRNVTVAILIFSILLWLVVGLIAVLLVRAMEWA